MPWNFGLLGGAASSSLTVVTGGSLFSDVDYYYRVFTSSGTLSVQGSPIQANILVVAGGGGGATSHAGGGGAGGYRTFSGTLNPQSYAITVGGGGAGATGDHIDGTKGTNSSMTGVLTSTGGGAGARANFAITGGSGGSGGGGGRGGGGGSGNEGNYSPAEGTNGGGSSGSAPNYGGGGGGGSASSGVSGTTTSGGNGGTGSLWLNNSYYAGGGGGGTYNPGSGAGIAGIGGVGGGGRGGLGDASNGLPGGINTGGGGGGGGSVAPPISGMGGSGVVIIRYPKTVLIQPPTGNIWASDSFASHLRIALPLNSVLGTADYSSSIRNSGTSRVATPVNSPLISGAQSKFYGTSLDNGLESQDRYISIPNSSDLTLGTSDFCVEGWWYFTNNSLGYQVLASHSGDSTDQQNGWVLTTETNNTLYFYATDAAGGWDVTMGGAQTPTANAWHHIAVTRSGNVFRLFYNGTQVNTQTVSVNIALPTSREFRLGSYRYIPGYPQSFNGFMQDFRMYIGTPKYTSNFTPPGAMYLGA